MKITTNGFPRNILKNHPAWVAWMLVVVLMTWTAWQVVPKLFDDHIPEDSIQAQQIRITSGRYEAWLEEAKKYHDPEMPETIDSNRFFTGQKSTSDED